MGCQKLIADSMSDQKGHYLLTVNDNQKKLKKLIESTLDKVRINVLIDSESVFLKRMRLAGIETKLENVG